MLRWFIKWEDRISWRLEEGGVEWQVRGETRGLDEEGRHIYQLPVSPCRYEYAGKIARLVKVVRS